MTPRIHWFPLITTLCLPLTAAAQEKVAETSAAAPTPAAAAVPTVSADLRSEYIAGEPLLVTIIERNEGTTDVVAPDLNARPWLVRFEYTRANQPNSMTRRTTPPSSDSGQTWKIPPKGQRRTLLEVPGSGAMEPGSYSMTVHVDTGAGEVSIGPVDLLIAPAHPVAGDVGMDASGGDRLGLQTPWLHQAKGGFDLYLQNADAKTPSKTIADYYLLRLDEKVSPVLTMSPSAEGWSRHIVWQSGEHGLSYVRLNGQGLGVSGPPRTVDAPWPVIDVAGRGATGDNGMLLVPIWVPAPRGDKGELRVLTVDERGKARFRKIARFDVRPPQVVTNVDAAGSVDFLVAHDRVLDGYTIRRAQTGTSAALAASEGVPVTGKRLWTVPDGETLLSSHYATLAQSESFPGGVALLAVTRAGETIVGHWLTTEGREFGKTEPNALPQGTTLVEVLPRSDMAFGYLAKSASGQTFYREGESEVLVERIAAEAHLVRDGSARPVLRELVNGGPVRTRVLAVTIPAPSPEPAP